MSTTTSDEEEIATTASGDETATDKKQRYKRRKIAIFFAYCGVGYQGMQKNPGTKTIEGELEEALFHFDAVPEQDRGCPKRYDWARTDKGVSAVGQVISGRFHIDPPGLVGRLNSILPSHIRIFGYKRVTASGLGVKENEKVDMKSNYCEWRNLNIAAACAALVGTELPGPISQFLSRW
ncbi:pseudouridylate synthase, putative [Ricinus communis]|uniref:Pseudouridylate synthase, putative n=1 Tax=Ricinus communis TaxID=3988 RepID=B9RAV6_RICCO|nr:pseudouridylate synthase, putative [Ricinus communis]